MKHAKRVHAPDAGVCLCVAFPQHLLSPARVYHGMIPARVLQHRGQAPWARGSTSCDS